MTTKRADSSRILIYSHDSFGLGHLRRCRTLAHALVAGHPKLSILILSGSPIIGSFDFRARVDFVRIPGVIKLRNGEYTSLNLLIDIEETLAMRSSIIEHTADIFDPDLMIVDKEPLGLRGEVKGTLERLRRRGTQLVLGLRDVMDEPSLLAPEWQRKNVLPALEELYDDIWVYGLPQICDPLEGLDLPAEVHRKVTFTGYLRRAASRDAATVVPPFDRPYVLVTPGGGGDGDVLVDGVIAAYETDRTMPHPALIVLGPFMAPERQAAFMQRASRLEDVAVITFDAHLENLMAPAVGVVAMGGYNTFCEILSFNKRALLVPRTRPRLEQYIRAARAEALGLVRVLPQEDAARPGAMIAALRRLPEQGLPSESFVPGLLDGLEVVTDLVGHSLARPAPPRLLTAR